MLLQSPKTRPETALQVEPETALQVEPPVRILLIVLAANEGRRCSKLHQRHISLRDVPNEGRHWHVFRHASVSECTSSKASASDVCGTSGHGGVGLCRHSCPTARKRHAKEKQISELRKGAQALYTSMPRCAGIEDSSRSRPALLQQQGHQIGIQDLAI